jgi:predicted nucleotidyltransferase
MTWCIDHYGAAGGGAAVMGDDTLLDQDPVLREIVERLVAVLQPARIYLFGSRARGDAGPDSDYDLLVLIREAEEPLYKLSQQAHSLLWDLGVAADIVVWTTDRFNRRTHLRASLPGTVLREGKLLYAV